MTYTLVSNGDVPDEDYFNLALMKQTVIVCTSGTRPSGPLHGMHIWETDTRRGMLYNASGSWVPSGVIDQSTYGMQWDDDTTTQSGITSTAWAAGSTTCGATFFAPPSGTVMVTVTGGELVQSSNGNEMRLSYSIREGSTIGSGTEIWAPSTFRAVACGRAVNASGPAFVSASHRRPLGSLTALAQYNIRTMHSVTGGTGAVSYRAIMVEPVL